MPSPVGNRDLSEAAHPNVQIKSESDKALGKRKASAEPPVAGDSDIDSECMEVDNPYTSGAPSTVTSDTRDDEVCQVVDEDCIITGRSGSLALSDVRLRLEPGLAQAYYVLLVAPVVRGGGGGGVSARPPATPSLAAPGSCEVVAQ